MATKIKLMRLGKMRAPYYRIVVADARTKRDGRSIETIGKYHPKEDPSFIEVDADRAAYWLGVGAQPTEAVTAILKVTGDWQKFKNEPAPPPMLVAAPKPDKHALFEAAAREGIDTATGAATTPKKKAAPKKAAAGQCRQCRHRCRAGGRGGRRRRAGDPRRRRERRRGHPGCGGCCRGRGAVAGRADDRGRCRAG